MVDRICAYKSPASVDFVPENCTHSACEAQRAAIRACPLVMSDRGTRCTGKLCRAATERLGGTPVAILGDSMARQAFFSLVAAMRGQSHLLDVNSWSSWRYARFANGTAFTDGLEELTETPAASGNWSGPQGKDSIVHAARNGMRLDKHAPPQVELFFAWCPCLGSTQTALARLPGRVRHIYLFVPTYWPMTGHCPSVLLDKETLRTIGLAPRPKFEPPLDTRDVKWYWKDTLVALAQSSVRHAHVTLIVPPLDHIHNHIRGARERQQTYNSALIRSFAAHDGIFFHHNTRWAVYDFGNLTARMGVGLASPTAFVQTRRAATGVVFGNWHYACSVSRRMRDGATTGVTHQTHGKLRSRLTVAARVDGGCSDHANARLWEDLLRAG